jgi:hypothetical protein
MIINQLERLPKENDLTTIIFDTFVAHAHIFRNFLECYAAISDFTEPTLAETWRDIPFGTPDMYFENDKYVLIFENKMKAGFTTEQLPRYMQGGKTAGKISKYFLIAPDTSRYKPGQIPKEYIRLTWDDIYNFLSLRSLEIAHDHKSKIDSVLSRYRYLYFCNLFDELYEQISKQSDITSPELFSKDDYHSHHIAIGGFTKLRFSIGIYLAAPSYLKLNPWWVWSDGNNYKIIATHNPVRRFRDELSKLPRTCHPLVRKAPGFVVDIKLDDLNTREAVCNEIVGLINKECREMISLYQNTIV